MKNTSDASFSSYSPPIPRSYKLREDKQEEVDEALARFSPAKKRALSPSTLEQEEESPNSGSVRRKRKRELDILMDDKKVFGLACSFCSSLFNLYVCCPQCFCLSGFVVCHRVDY